MLVSEKEFFYMQEVKVMHIFEDIKEKRMYWTAHVQSLLCF